MNNFISFTVLIALIVGIIIYLAYIVINKYMKNGKISALIVLTLTFIIYFSYVFYFTDPRWRLVALIFLSPIPIVGGLIAIIINWIIKRYKKGKDKTLLKSGFFTSLTFRRLVEGIILITILITFSETIPQNYLEAIKYKGAYIQDELIEGRLGVSTTKTDYKPELLKRIYYENKQIPNISEFTEEDLKNLSFNVTYQPKAKYVLSPVILEDEKFEHIREISSQRSNILSAMRFEKWGFISVHFFNTGKEKSQKIRGNVLIDTLRNQEFRMYYLMVNNEYIVGDFDKEKISKLKEFLELSYHELIYQMVYYTILYTILICFFEFIIFLIKKYDITMV